VTSIIGNYALGRFVEKCSLPLGTDGILVIPLQNTALPTDAVLRNCLNLGAVFTAGAVEANFTNIGARRVLTAPDITITVNTTTFLVNVAFATQNYAAAGGAVNNTISKIVIAYRPTSGTADSGCMVLATQDYSATTGGGALTITPGILTDDAP
jgi:uncharacterized protein with beta-barrel porin domain